MDYRPDPVGLFLCYKKALNSMPCCWTSRLATGREGQGSSYVLKHLVMHSEVTRLCVAVPNGRGIIASKTNFNKQAKALARHHKRLAEEGGFLTRPKTFVIKVLFCGLKGFFPAYYPFVFVVFSPQTTLVFTPGCLPKPPPLHP